MAFDLNLCVTVILCGLVATRYAMMLIFGMLYKVEHPVEEKHQRHFEAVNRDGTPWTGCTEIDCGYGRSRRK